MPAPSDRALLRLIDAVYGAALDPSQWPAFLGCLSQEFNGSAAWLFSLNASNLEANLVEGVGFGEGFLEAHTSHYYRVNPFLQRAMVLPEGAFISREALDTSSYKNSEFYNDWVKPQGFFDFAGTSLVKDGNLHVGICMMRSSNPGALDAPEIDAWQALMPHLRRAAQIHQQLFAVDLRQGGAMEALYKLNVGLILAAADGEVLFCNEVADELLTAGNGLRAQHGRLCGATPAATAALQKMLRDVAATSAGRDTHPGGLIVVPRALEDSLSVLISPVHAESGLPGWLGRPAAMVLVSDPRRKRGARQSDVARVFGLTPAEARLLVALTDGLSLAEYAESADISVSTARVQIKQVFVKMGEHRQSALIRRVLTDPILTRER